jgi:TIR domain
MDQDNGKESAQTSNQAPLQVFISYAREDYGIAERLYNDLKRAGLDPWLDKKKILGGQHWKKEIREAIRNSAYFIPLFSSTSVKK